jgi:polyribonucleotide nucleotidyltransferase
MTAKKFEMTWHDKKLTLEIGKFANQADASVVAQIGETVVLATASMSQTCREGMDFFPLMVDLEERYFAAGKIKGPRFSKREGRPSNDAILTSRMIDRGLRPLFPQNIKNDVQIICMPLALDGVNKPDVVAMVAACAALHISRIPFDGPIAGARIAMINGDFIVNPTLDEMEFSDMNLVVMGDGSRITMVDCSAKEVDDKDTKACFKAAMDSLGQVAAFIETVRKEIGAEKTPLDQLKLRGQHTPEDAALMVKIKAAATPHLEKYLFNTPKGSKGARKAILHDLEDKLAAQFTPTLVTKTKDAAQAEAHVRKLMSGFFYDYIEEQVTLAILDRNQRVDGRALDQIRTLTAETSVLPRVHGTGLFTRGETQVLSVVTLGSPGDKLTVETGEADYTKTFYHHYNFLPCSVGDVKPLRGAGRREIGHGALAEKAMLPVMPANDDFPYTIRVVSEVMGSNGSSSMASTCGASLALMDAGVPLKKHVAGMAMGLACDGKRWKVITDLQDLEDGAGGMDFKFTSTRQGVTAIQMDTKTRGLTMEMIDATVVQMRKGINEVLDVLEAALPAPRTELSKWAPRIISFHIDPEKIGDVIGPGGKVIRKITEEYGVQIDVNDEGLVVITSVDSEDAKAAETIIKNLVRTVEIGEIFEEAVVVKMMSFGAFVTLTPNQDGLLHVSEIDWARVENVEDRLKLGDKVRVKVISIDRGKVDVSARELLPKPEGYVEQPRRERTPSRGGDRRGGDRRGGGGRGGGRGGDRRGGDRR